MENSLNLRGEMGWMRGGDKTRKRKREEERES